MLSSHNSDASLWDSATGQEVARIRHGRPVRNAKFSPDGTRLLSLGEDGSTWLWDAATEHAPLVHNDPARAA